MFQIRYSLACCTSYALRAIDCEKCTHLSNAVAFFISRSSRAIANSHSSSRKRNLCGGSLARSMLALNVPASYKATHVLSDLWTISKLRLTSTNVKPCYLNKLLASFLNLQVKNTVWQTFYENS